MKKFCILFLVLALSVPTFAFAGSSIRLEGDGFDSPEEAVLAYIEGMNQEDVGLMLSTFAMETFVDHLDPDAYVLRANSIWPSMADGIPITDDYSKSLVLYSHFAYLMNMVKLQYMDYALEMNGETHAPMNVAAITELHDMCRESPLGNLRGQVEFVEWIDPKDLTFGNYIYPQNRVNIAISTCYYDPDDVAERVAHIRIHGNDAIQTMQCARFGDRWYNIVPQGNIGSILGLNMGMNGLLIFTEENEDYSSYLNRRNTDPEYITDWQAIQESNLGGTQWILQSLNDQSITICQDPDISRNSNCHAVFAKLKFNSLGGAVIMVVSDPSLGMNEVAAHIAFSWTERNEKLMIDNDVRVLGDFSSLNTDVVSVEKTDTQITFTLSDGTIAVFEMASNPQ